MSVQCCSSLRSHCTPDFYYIYFPKNKEKMNSLIKKIIRVTLFFYGDMKKTETLCTFPTAACFELVLHQKWIKRDENSPSLLGLVYDAITFGVL